MHEWRPNPPYNSARGVNLYDLAIGPPFEFEGAQMQFFPLRVQFDRLQTFIDQYLNIVPEEVGVFRVFSPFVFLVSIYYGKMSLDASNLGWLAQNEAFFSVPLLWYKRVGGELVFHDFATISPFIYVDSDHSMTTGREVFGWPKTPVTVDRLAPTWMADPDAKAVIVRFNAMVFPELYAGKRQSSQPLLEIEDGRAESSLLRSPFDPRASWLPWVALPAAVTASLDMARDGMEILRGLGLVQLLGGAGLDTYPRMLARVMEMSRSLGADVGFNTLNLKQLRDAEKPHLACYQAITNAPLTWRRIQRAGLLGEDQVLRGDPSGGFSINLYHYPTAPIVETLGLEVEEEHTLGRRTVHTLRPVLPLWLEADLRYDLGKTIAWRAKDVEGGRVWHADDGVHVDPARRYEECRYDTALGAAAAEVTGPFDFPNVTARVMPLLADEERLTTFLREYLGPALREDGGGLTIEPWGRYVYLVAFNVEEMSSHTNDIGWWASRELTFLVPVLVKRAGKLWKIALVPAYTYDHSTTSALSGSEVNGIPTTSATLESPGDRWMDDGGPSGKARRTLLRASVALLPAVGLGQKVDTRPFLEVFEGEAMPAEAREAWRGVAEGWGSKLKAELQERRGADERRRRTASSRPGAPGDRDALAYALDVLTLERPVPRLTLKQLRDAEDPQHACYRAVVELDQTITRVHAISEMERGLYVRIHRYPTLPIAEKLGLVPMMEETGEQGVLVRVFEAIRPFWMKVSMREALGKNLFVHPGGCKEAKAPPAALDPVDRAAVGRAVRCIEQDGDEPRRLRDLVARERFQMVEAARGGQGGTPARPLDPEGLVAGFDPQFFVERILSGEWERWDDCRWEEARARIQRGRAAACRGMDALGAVLAEVQYLEALGRERGVFDGKHEGIWPWLFSVAEHRMRAAWYKEYAYLAHIPAVADRWQAEWAKISDALSLEPGAWSPEGDDHDRKHEAAYYERHSEEVYGWLCTYLAQAEGKPPLVVRRDTIANPEERERLFPREWSWYDGRERTQRSDLPA